MFVVKLHNMQNVLYEWNESGDVGGEGFVKQYISGKMQYLELMYLESFNIIEEMKSEQPNCLLVSIFLYYLKNGFSIYLKNGEVEQKMPKVQNILNCSKYKIQEFFNVV